MRPIIPIAEYGAPASGVDLSPSDADDTGFTPSEGGAASPPRSIHTPPPSRPPVEIEASPSQPMDLVNLTQGAAVYRGFAIYLDAEEKAQINQICVQALERQFTTIIKGLRDELPTEGR